MSCPRFGATMILISTSVRPSSSSLTRIVSSTCTTESAPTGSGAPVLMRTQNPDVTTPFGCNKCRQKNYKNRSISLGLNNREYNKNYYFFRIIVLNFIYFKQCMTMHDSVTSCWCWSFDFIHSFQNKISVVWNCPQPHWNTPADEILFAKNNKH